MIWAFVFAAISVWFFSWVVRLLWIAKSRGYVMALTKPFEDTVETPQTRKGNPQKFWANVIVAILLLPVAVGAVWFSFSDLWTVFFVRGG